MVSSASPMRLAQRRSYGRQPPYTARTSNFPSRRSWSELRVRHATSRRRDRVEERAECLGLDLGYYDEDPCRIGCRRLFVLFGGLARVLLVVVGYAYGALLSDSSATVGAVTECVESRKKLALGSGSPTVGKLYARELQVRTERRMGSGPS